LVDISSIDSESVKKNGVWNGNGFTGGTEQVYPMSNVFPNKKAVLADSKLLIVFANDKSSIEDKMLTTYLNSSIKIIELTENQIVAPGFVWDGTSFNPPQ